MTNDIRDDIIQSITLKREGERGEQERREGAKMALYF